jgi:hypothetical protein
MQRRVFSCPFSFVKKKFKKKLIGVRQYWILEAGCFVFFSRVDRPRWLFMSIFFNTSVIGNKLFLLSLLLFVERMADDKLSGGCQ